MADRSLCVSRCGSFGAGRGFWGLGWVGLGLLVEWRLVIVIVMLRPAGLGQEKQRKGGCGPERIGGGEEEGQAVEIFF